MSLTRTTVDSVRISRASGKHAVFLRDEEGNQCLSICPEPSESERRRHDGMENGPQRTNTSFGEDNL